MRLVFLQQMLQIEHFAHRGRLLVTTAAFLCNGYHAGKYSMVPDACSVKSLEITKKLKGTNGLDEYLPEVFLCNSMFKTFTFF